ncbi:MAG: hypothetical protein ACE37K_19815 [Planctomycetota bacterium]
MSEPDDDRIDDLLRAAFVPPPDEAFAAMAESARQDAPAPGAAPRPLWPWLLAAAAVMLVGVLVFDALQRPDRPDAYRPAELGAMWAAAYDHAIDTGFGGGGCCEAPTDLAQRCREVCGQALSFGGRGDVQLLGCYCGLSTGGCLGLMLQVDGAPISVFVLRADQDPRPVLEGRDELVLQRRALGELVLYSIGYERREQALAGFSL